MSGYALGLIETRGLVGAIAACDAAAKAAQVRVTSAEVTDGGLVSLKMIGDLAAVRAAVDAGSVAAEKIGELISAHVIPRPDGDLAMICDSGEFFDGPNGDDSISSPSGEHRTGRTLPAKRSRRTDAKPKPPTQTRSEMESSPQAPAPVSVPPPPSKPTPAPSKPKEEPTESRATLADLEAMPVVKLRQFARAVKNLPIQGRQISMANKTQLIEALKSVMNLE